MILQKGYIRYFCAPICRSDASVEEAERCVSWRHIDGIIIGAGSTHNKREFSFPVSTVPGNVRLSPVKPTGAEGGGARSNVFNYTPVV